MNDLLLLETLDQHEENLCLPAGLYFPSEVKRRIGRVQVGNTTVRPIAWDHAPGAGIRFDLEHVLRSDRATPDDAEKVFQRLMARGAALKAESVAVIEQAHRVQARSRVLRARSAGLVSGRLFQVN
jgi:hypothetical protein